MSSSIGRLFRVTTYGESHGGRVGVVVDGVPGNISISLERMQLQLSRRRPGQSKLVSPRDEQDVLEVSSGLENGVTLGSPVHLSVRNRDIRPSDYASMANIYRPSHADYTMEKKYGIRASSGGGRASARETLARVAAGALAEEVLLSLYPEIKVVAYVDQVGPHLSLETYDRENLDRVVVDSNPLRCPDSQKSGAMESCILEAMSDGDSVGGVIRCMIYGLPVGVGEPVFDKLEACLAHGMLSIPAARGFEIGSGFAASSMMGSQHNDPFISLADGTISTESNFSGGVQAGITNGQDVSFRVAFKPVSTIMKPQSTVDKDGNQVNFKPAAGRHDPCVVPRAVPVVESMASMILLDHLMIRYASHRNFS